MDNVNGLTYLYTYLSSFAPEMNELQVSGVIVFPQELATGQERCPSNFRDRHLLQLNGLEVQRMT